MAKFLQGLSYKVCSTIFPKLFIFVLFLLVFGIASIIHQQFVAMLRGHLRFVCTRSSLKLIQELDDSLVHPLMQVSISSITIPCAFLGICTKTLPPPWGCCILAFSRGWRFVGIALEGQAFVYKRFLPFLEFPL